ncbi:hypothetical protein [Paenibacillus hexagrammi]|uniref:Uncharacterized protein n=1 Tax=Paenibacillus hexagrammi TaxID=2908839 RepID=A0ABY3SKS3_9BACL|nr:hypothetical protein [Paenibacillus sp. YPD9-1]UJF33745.1 hypothetical protein L0M14_00295 [Paenibacillus sp. YPD9-1]
MKQRIGILEGILIKVTIVMLFGFGVGMISIQEDWRKAIEAIGIGTLMLAIYLMGRKIEGFMKDDDEL